MMERMEQYQKMLEEQAAQQGGGAQNKSKVTSAKLSDDDENASPEVKFSRAKQKEYEKMIIREARRRQAEKYGEEFIDDDED